MIVRNLGVVNYDTVAGAIAEAHNYFHNAAPAGQFVIRFPAGLHRIIPPAGEDRCIDLTGIAPAVGGRLILQGTRMRDTTIVTPEEPYGIYADNIARITVRAMTFTRDQQMTTQGHVVEVGPGYIVIRLQQGFPRIDEVFDGDSKVRDVRVYTDIGGRVVRSLPKISWKSYEHIGGRTWKLIRFAVNQTAPFQRGQLLAVRSKYGGMPYRIVGGDDFRFERVLWTRRTRGVFFNVDNVAILDCVIERPPPIKGQMVLLAGNGGGPQIHGKNGRTVRGIVARGNNFRGTGDDSLALFNVAEGRVENNRIFDSFARGILLNNSPNVKPGGNRLVRAPIERVTETVEEV